MPLYAIALGRDDQRELRALRWGLVPSWAKSPAIGARLVNARSEEVQGKAAFRHAIRTGRVLVPVSGFYEWRRGVPFYFSRADGAPLALAGLGETWHGDHGPPLQTCTLLTTRANAVVATVHDRMPVVLAPGDWEEWLCRQALEPGRLDLLLAPAQDGHLCCRRVGSAVNNVRNDSPDLVLPVTSAEEVLVEDTLF